MSPFLLLFEAYRLVLRALVLVMSVQLVTATLAYLRRRPRPVPPPPAVWPRVTVQLPLRNEYYTAERVIEAAGALDYPRELLEIQILDDSDDDTVRIVGEAAARLRARGLDVVELRRSSCAGYKAGALAEGFAQAKGEYLAVFDADSIPDPDFLRRILPYFDGPKVGLVQGRWEHRNRYESWFTALQARILDGLMVVEQTAKSDAGIPLQFNGTAGVWRRSAIEAAGGWRFDSLTEDFDLSLRAVLAGFTFVHVPEIAVKSELPTTLGLFRVQQRRWALGTAQLFRKHFLDVVRAPLPLGSRLALALQLLRHFGYPILLVMVITVPLTTFSYITTPVEYGALNAAVFVVAVASVAFQQTVAERAIHRRTFSAVALAPLSILLAIGLAPTYSVALWYGLRDRAGPFHRTPKVLRTAHPGEPVYRAKRSLLVGGEIAIGVAYAWFSSIELERGFYTQSAFLVLVTVSYLWVGLGSLRGTAA